MAKRLSAMQETQVQSLGWEDPLEKEMATHSSILAWKIPWTSKSYGYDVHGVTTTSVGSQRVIMTEWLHKDKERHIGDKLPGFESCFHYLRHDTWASFFYSQWYSLLICIIEKIIVSALCVSCENKISYIEIA